MIKKLLIMLLTLTMLCTVGCSNKTTVDTDTSDETGEVTESVTEATETEPKFKFPEDIELTDTQREAADSVEEHLNGANASRITLINTLVEEGYSEEDAIFVVDSFGLDWMEMARGAAEFYTLYMPFSYKGIIDHLVYMKFTEAEAQYGADQLEVDWDANAAKYIEKYYMYESFPYDELVAELEEAGFTHEQAVNGIKEYEDDKAAESAQESSLREELGLGPDEPLASFDDLDTLGQDNDSLGAGDIAIIVSISVATLAAVIAIPIIVKKSRAKKNNKKKKK